MSAGTEGLTVFAVYVSDCTPEGGTVAAVFSTEEKAREYALACVEDAKDEEEWSRRYHLACGSNREPHVWAQETATSWGNGAMSRISIVPYEVDNSNSFRSFEETKAKRWELSPEDCAKDLP